VRPRDRIIDELERVYRRTYVALEKEGDQAALLRLDLDFQRDQLQLEALIDMRDLLMRLSDDTEAEGAGRQAKNLIDKARSFRTLIR